ncbi:MAG TPA: ATP-binding protein, partial [Burkholderiaceae bacterium]
MKLRTHYLLLIGAILLPVVLFSGLSLKLLLDAQRSAAIARIAESARATALVIDADVGRAQAVLRTLSGSYALARNDLAAFREEAIRANAGDGAWIILYDESGQQLVNTRREPGEALPKRPDPEVLAALLRTRQGVVSGIRWGVALNNRFVAVEQPIVTASGRKFGLLQAYSPSYFSKAFSERQLPATWLVGVFDRDGIIIARSHNADKFVGKKAKPEILQALAAAPHGLLRHTTSDGRDVYDIFTHAPLAGWSVVIGAPVDEIDALVWRGMLLTGAGLVLAFAAMSVLAAYTGRWLIGYMRRAGDAAQALGRGEAPALPRSHIREINEFSLALSGAHGRLLDEQASRAAAEAERNDLLVRERQARAVAEEQNAAKDQFLAMLGHELRNPLSAITGAVAVLDDTRTSASAALRARDIVRRQSAHLRTLVNDLLDVHRTLMGKTTLVQETVAFERTVADCVDARLASGRANGCTFALDLAPACVLGDATRLAQIIDNLLDNAVKYSPAGTAIAVSLHADGGKATLQVRDEGQGIAPELLPRIFDVFVQGEQSLQRLQGGLGIGLTLVRRLVEMHGGSVAIASAGAGLGTTVTVVLPLTEPDTQAQEAAVTKAAAPRRRVLLVEDNDDARDMMSLLIGLQGCDVATAADGPAALDLAASYRPEVGFVDIGLPGMDGYAVVRELRARFSADTMRLVALTGYGSEQDRLQALGAGFDSHLVK